MGVTKQIYPFPFTFECEAGGVQVYGVDVYRGGVDHVWVVEKSAVESELVYSHIYSRILETSVWDFYVSSDGGQESG